MDISSEGKDLLASIDEALSSEYECFEMLMAFDNGSGPKNFATDDVIKVLKKTEGLINDFLDELSIYDTTILYEGILGINDGNFEFGISFSVPKEKMIITRTINELLSKYLKEQTNAGNMPYDLIQKKYLTIDLINLVISILNKMAPNFDEDIQKQIVIIKYQLIYCMKEVGDTSLSNKYENVSNPLLIHKTVHSFCNVSNEQANEFVNNWVMGMYFNSLNGILKNKSTSLSILDIVYCATMRALLLFTDEDFASDLMYDTMNYLRSGKIPNFDEALVFEAITSRFDDEEMPQFLSFIR